MIRVVRSVVLVVVAGMLAGCGAVPTERPTPPSAPVGVAEWRDSRCDGLQDAERFGGLWTDPLAPAGYESFGATSVWNMQGSALIQAGSLVCTWRGGDAASSALVIAMGDGAEGFRRSEAAFGDPGSEYVAVERWDGAFVTCRTAGGAPRCHWNVLDGTTWVSVFVSGIPQSEVDVDDLATSAAADVVDSFVTGIAELDLPPAARGSDAWSCASTLTQDAVAEALDVEASRLGASPGAPVEYALGRSTPEFGQVMWAYAHELLGYRECHLALDDQIAASIVSAPDGAWLFDDPAVVPDDLVDVAGLGRGLDHCETEGSFTLCTLAVTRGDDLVVVQVPVLTTEDAARAQAAALAALIVA